MRSRRDREQTTCADCGKRMTIRRDGGLMAHRDSTGKQCVCPAWKQRNH